MPHFKVSLDPVSISITSAALGPNVWPSLRMARAALDEAVDGVITERRSVLASDIEREVASLREAAAFDIAMLRAARKAALKVREAGLPPAPAEAA